MHPVRIHPYDAHILASILPGVRQVRTPLVTGCLWLFLVWLWVGSSIESATEGNGTVKRIDDLLSWITTGTAVAALGFIAYLVGSLLTIERWPPGPLQNARSVTRQRVDAVRYRTAVQKFLVRWPFRWIWRRRAAVRQWRYARKSRRENDPMRPPMRGAEALQRDALVDTEIMAWARRQSILVNPDVTMNDIRRAGRLPDLRNVYESYIDGG